MKYDLLKMMDDLNIEYQYLEHEPITDHDSAIFVNTKYNLKGKESKNLVLRGKSGNYYVMVSEEGVRFNRSFMKELVGEKLTLATPEELNEKTGYVVGCAASFGYDEDVTIVVDENIFRNEFFICSGGNPTSSIVIRTEDLKKIYATVSNKIIYTKLDYE